MQSYLLLPHNRIIYVIGKIKILAYLKFKAWFLEASHLNETQPILINI